MSLLAYRKATEWCMVISWPETFLKVFIISHCFLGKSLGFSSFGTMSSAVEIPSLLPLLFIFILISFSYIFAPVKASSTILNENSESGHSCLIPDVREMFSVFPIWYHAVCKIIIYNL